MRPEQLPQHLIFLTLHGSHAYGTATATSDIDIRGVAIAPLPTYFGTRPWEQLRDSTPFTQTLLQQRMPHATDPADCEVFNLTKFVRLAADANPNILDILFAHPDDWLYSTPAWERLYEHRHLFLSMRVRYTYTGYAMSQLKRIQTHRRWLLSPTTEKPTRSAFGLPENESLVPKDVQDMVNALMRKQIEIWHLDALIESMEEEQKEEIRDAMRAYFEMVHGRPYNPDGDHEQEQAALQIGLNEELWKRIDAERRYKNALHDWKQYEQWKQHRNEARAELEARFGYDCKHGSHLVRLLLSAEELLSTGDLSVRHPQADLLREVRAGAWDYETLMQWAETQERKIIELANHKRLPHSPPRDAIDALVTELVLSFHSYQRPD